jgi:hypothetical protein
MLPVRGCANQSATLGRDSFSVGIPEPIWTIETESAAGEYLSVIDVREDDVPDRTEHLTIFRIEELGGPSLAALSANNGYRSAVGKLTMNVSRFPVRDEVFGISGMRNGHPAARRHIDDVRTLIEYASQRLQERAAGDR